MSAYWIARVDVTDKDVYQEYARLATEAIAEHGGRFLARGGRWVGLEGENRDRNVIVEFPSIEDAVTCYESETYRKAREFAGRSATRELVIVEGVG